jgi:hypothetical protein
MYWEISIGWENVLSLAANHDKRDIMAAENVEQPKRVSILH